MKYLIGLCMLVIGAELHGQVEPKYSAISSPVGSRFEIVQSPLLARLTFKLDRFNGRVWQLVVDSSNGTSWQSMAVLPPPSVAATASTPRFQLFLSGMVARDSLLLDTMTGAVWRVTENTEGKHHYFIWAPIPHSK